MKRLIFIFLILLGFILTPLYAAEANLEFILLISEQNIEGPQTAWWASEIDLSVTEATIAQRLIQQGYEVLDPSNLTKIISQQPAFRKVVLSEAESVKLGRLSQADYLILGKAIASSGADVPQSKMRSCFANLSAKLIRVKDGKVVAYLDATGNSAHMDVITGGKEALVNAARELVVRLMDALIKEGEIIK